MNRWAEINLLRLIVGSPKEFIQNMRPFSAKFLINRKSYVMAANSASDFFLGWRGGAGERCGPQGETKAGDGIWERHRRSRQ
ncbi:MAG: hypothetical protein ACI9OJ_002056 [Myxococcota bacterium]|jgi:hypothetical protein